MQPANIRQKLHQYVDKGDEKLLKLMYAVAKEYTGEDDFEYKFSALYYYQSKITQVSNNVSSIVLAHNQPS